MNVNKQIGCHINCVCPISKIFPCVLEHYKSTHGNLLVVTHTGHSTVSEATVLESDDI